jgi:transcriptional regulator with XRE-family HTH domain
MRVQFLPYRNGRTEAESMPRPNQPRTLGTERTLARRVRWEREGKGMTYEGLAGRMAAAGCAIQPSALYKIEKNDPPRRITVDELVALAQVFEVSIPELLLPHEVVADRDLRRLLESWRDARLKEVAATAGLVDYVTAHPDVEDVLEGMFNDDDWTALVADVLADIESLRRSGSLAGSFADMKKAHEQEARRGKRRS